MSLDNTVNNLRDNVEELRRRDKLLEDASDRQSKLTDEHILKHLIEPACQVLFPMIDYCDKAVSSGIAENNGNTNVYDGFRDELLTFLARFGVEPIPHCEQSMFDRTCMHTLARLMTSDKSRDKKVAKWLDRGFRREGKVLKPVQVQVYEYSPRQLSGVKEGI